MSKTLLLADDSVVIQKLVGLSFANEDVEIIATDNGDDAVARAHEVNPDIVLADVVMPGKSGYEVCEAIKQDPNLAHVPVLLLTGTFEAFDEARAASAGANGQITKPFEAQSLVERVNSVIAEVAASGGGAAAAFSSGSGADSGTPSGADVDVTAEAFFNPSAASNSASDSAAGTGDAEEDAADALPAFGRRVTDPTESPTARRADERAGQDVSESDFFDRQETPRLDASALIEEPRVGMGAEEAEDDLLLNSPGLEMSQDLDADFSDSPLAPYAQALQEESTLPPASDFTADAEDATVASLPPVRTDRSSGSRESVGVSAANADVQIDDGLGIDDSLPMPEAITPPPVDLHGQGDTDATDADDKAYADDDVSAATILVGTDDINASTASDYSYGMPPSRSMDEAASSEETSGVFTSESLTVHAPSERIDRDAAFASSPEQTIEPARDAAVANLDASLSEEIEDAVLALPSDPDPLSLEPSNVGGEDLDFAFDVSEQREVLAAEAVDDDPFSAIADVSESQVIGRDRSEAATTEVADPADAETRVGDYDVSSSDLATALPTMAAAAAGLGLAGVASDRGVEVSEAVESPFAAHTSDTLETSDTSDASEDSYPSQLSGPEASGHYAVGLGSSAASEAPFAPEPAETGADADFSAAGASGSGLSSGSGPAQGCHPAQGCPSEQAQAKTGGCRISRL